MLGAGAGLATRRVAARCGRTMSARSSRRSPLVNGYVDSRKVANLFVTLGWDQEDHAHSVAAGTLGFGSAVQVKKLSTASMTKPITGMATMMCIGDGHFELDAPWPRSCPPRRHAGADEPDAPLDQTVAAERAIPAATC